MAEPELDAEGKPTHKYASKAHKKQQFLDAFSRMKTIWAASRAVGVSRNTIINWRKLDPEFRAAFEVADVECTEQLETVAHDRALKGKSDQLLIFLLKSRNPDKYKERVQHDLDPKVMDILVSQFINVIKKNVNDVCPHCNTHLGLTTAIAKDLEALSLTLGSK